MRVSAGRRQGGRLQQGGKDEENGPYTPYGVYRPLLTRSLSPGDTLPSASRNTLSELSPLHHTTHSPN